LGWDHQFLPADESMAFAAWLKETIAARDYAQMETLMSDPFAIARWRSEGQFYAPEQAVEQLRNNYLGTDTHVNYPERDITVLLGETDPFALFGPEVHIVRILFASGWGLGGDDEALLYIAQASDGTYRWHGILTAAGGFGQSTAVMTWHREGGIAGFCDELVVDGSGEVHAISCTRQEPREVGVGLLTGDRLDQLQSWVGEYRSIEIERADPATADAITVRLTLDGRGTAAVEEPEVEAMLDFAAQLYAELGNVADTNVHYVMAQRDLEIHSGPAPDYAVVGALFEGQMALVTGQSLDGSWWRVICPDDTVGSCWMPAEPELVLPVAPPPGSRLDEGVLATFQVRDEQFRVWVTNPQTIEQIMALQVGDSTANIPNGRILQGPGPGAHNLP
jgi:hypothetical protein